MSEPKQDCSCATKNPTMSLEQGGNVLEWYECADCHKVYVSLNKQALSTIVSMTFKLQNGVEVTLQEGATGHTTT